MIKFIIKITKSTIIFNKVELIWVRLNKPETK